jgi:hypothetical protein
MHGRVWIAVLLLAFSCTALAQGIAERAQASMQVTGTMDIDAAGAVTGHAIDHPGAIGKTILGLIDQALPTWRFEPLPSGAAAPATPMSLMIVGTQDDRGRLVVRIKSVHVGNSDIQPDAEVAAVSLTPPGYPARALRARIEGIVHVVVRIDRTGHVSGAMAEQVNVGPMDSEAAMARARKLLADATLATARTWTFRPPTTGGAAGDPYWLGTIPVQYMLSGSGHPEYGQWQVYVPGPKQAVPWADPQGRVRSDSDALAAGTFSAIGSGRRLLTALDPG